MSTPPGRGVRSTGHPEIERFSRLWGVARARFSGAGTGAVERRFPSIFNDLGATRFLP
jgi:hypothetical protein